MPATKPHPAKIVEPMPAAAPTGINRWYWIALTVLLLLAVVTRLLHITQPPFDFHAQRQFWDANRARAMYYESLSKHGLPPEDWKIRIAEGNREVVTEPPIIETLAVWGYNFAGGEDLAIPRGISSVAFVLAGLFLFLLATRVMHPAGALFATAVFLFLPFNVMASRTFQPEPISILFTAISLFASYRYSEKPTMTRAIWAGIFAGLAILAKVTVIFFVVGVPVALMLLHMEHDDNPAKRGWRNLLRKESLVAIALVLLPFLWYAKAVLFPSAGVGVGAQASISFLPHLFLTPEWYKSIFDRINESLTWPLLVVAVLGLFFARNRGLRAILIGGWAGYLVYLILFNYHTASHVYYHLPFMLIAALSIAVWGHLIALRLAKAPRALTVILVCVFGIGVFICMTYDIARNNHPRFIEGQRVLEDIGEIVQHSPNVISLSIGYGYPLKFYGFTGGGFWPAQVDLSAEALRGQQAQTTEERLDKFIHDEKHPAEYFAVTDWREYSMQPELQHLLETKYTLVARTPDFVIFDLRHPLKK